MSGSRDEDLDWLYGRGPGRSEPEPTRVLPVPDERDLSGRGPEAVGDPAGPRPGPAGAPAHLPAGYPAVPGHRQGRTATPGGTAPPGGPGGPGVPPWGPGGPPLQPPGRQRRRHPVRNTVRVLLVLVLLALVWLVGVPAYAWSHVSRVDDTPSGRRPGNQPGQTFLLVGSDSREGLSRAQQKKLGTGSVGGRRTDTIMLVHVPETGKPALVSIPRDSYVPVPGNGTDKINTAYAFGGPDLLVQTVEQATGLRLDGYVEIGFGGFVTVIDALDGIRMCLPSAIKDRDSHLDLKKGCQTLGGTDALGYVRMRKADPRGDLGRVERQRQMLAAVAKKGASPATVLNPVRYWRLCNAGADSVRIGRGTSFVEVASMGLAMRRIANDQGLTLTVPVSDPDAATPVGSAVLWDSKRAADMFAEMARGDTSDLARYAK